MEISKFAPLTVPTKSCKSNKDFFSAKYILAIAGRTADEMRPIVAHGSGVYSCTIEVKGTKYSFQAWGEIVPADEPCSCKSTVGIRSLRLAAIGDICNSKTGEAVGIYSPSALKIVEQQAKGSPFNIPYCQNGECSKMYAS